MPFLRERIDATAVDGKSAYISALFEHLLTTPWSIDIEVEAFAVLRRLSADEDADERLSVELPALHRLIDAMLVNRIAAGEQQLHDQGALDKLPRREFAAKKAEIAEIDATFKAKIAERELFLREQIGKAQAADKWDEVPEIEQQLAREVRRLNADCEEKKEKARTRKG